MPHTRPPENVSGTWLLYGAYGYTGRLLAMEALRRGHRPILAGRSAHRLRDLAGELEGRTVRELAVELGHPPGEAARGDELSGPGSERSDPERAFPALPVRVLSLDDPGELRRGLEGVRAVFHAAGPFLHTAPPMLEACVETGAHYLDISGEVPAFEAAFALDEAARRRGVALLPGVGMDVVPTDGAAAQLARALPSAHRLELALHSPGKPSAGTLRTIVEGVPGGLLVRRDGRLVGANPGRSEFRRWIDFGPEEEEGPMAGRLGGRRSVAPYTWGDLATAWRTTGIDHVTCYLTTPRPQVLALPAALPILRAALAVGPLRRAVARLAARRGRGPSRDRRRTGRVRAWGRVEDPEGRWADLVLELPEGYRFTAMAGIRALEALSEETGHAGALTPAGAFGAGWVLGLPEVEVVRAARVHEPGE